MSGHVSSSHDSSFTTKECQFLLTGEPAQVAAPVSHILAKLNAQTSLPDLSRATKERNIIIRARHTAGISQAELAHQFGISYQHVHQIVHGRRK